jgi:predicted lipoprotein with Yx(FWY)xxD motif
VEHTIRAAGTAALLLVATACGSGYVPASQAVPVGSSPGPAARAPASPAGGLSIASTPIGAVVTSEGHTLYRYAKDTATPPTTTCVGACATAWPPLPGDGVPAVDGLSADLVGTVGRPDGTQQLTLDGWPLYRFAGDTAPGDVHGHGVGGTWQAIAPDGTPVAATAPDAAPDTAPDTGGSGY